MRDASSLQAQLRDSNINCTSSLRLLITHPPKSLSMPLPALPLVSATPGTRTSWPPLRPHFCCAVQPCGCVSWWKTRAGWLRFCCCFFFTFSKDGSLIERLKQHAPRARKAPNRNPPHERLILFYIKSPLKHFSILCAASLSRHGKKHSRKHNHHKKKQREPRNRETKLQPCDFSDETAPRPNQPESHPSSSPLVDTSSGASTIIIQTEREIDTL